MKGLSNPARRRRRVTIDAAMVMMVQMGLLTATLESYLAGHRGVAMPALLSTTALFDVCAFFCRLVIRVDRMQESVSAAPGEQAPGPWRIGARR